MPLPDDIHAEDKNYVFRVCMLVKDDVMVGLLNGSKVHLCDDCGQAIWVDEAQVVPPPPPDMEVHGQFAICMPCMTRLAKDDPKPIEFLNKPDDLY